jgi:hypothetical protein
MFHSHKGMSLVDVVVGTSITLAIFLALVGILRVSLALSAVAKAQVGATVVANTQMEYIRSLDYDVVGTVGGVPNGVLQQYATATQNNIQFVTRTFISYVDSPKDGSGVSDANGITTDYKQVKVEVKYQIKEQEYEVELVTTVVPPGIETSAGGGTLLVDVVSSNGVAVPDAQVRIVNASTSPTIDITTYTNSTGQVLLGGAPTSTQYQIYVSKDNYSSAQTYARNTSNPNPLPGYLTVVEGQTTTQTFAIDTLSQVTLATYLPEREVGFYDSFVSGDGVSSFASTTIVGQSVSLTASSSVYDALGTVSSDLVSTTHLAQWNEASTSVTLAPGTTLRVRVADESAVVINDTDLPGNSTGFTTFPISLSGLSTTTYDSLILIAELSTSDTSVTPQLLDWGVSYMTTKIPQPNVALSVVGDKSIGTTEAGAAIVKTSFATTTNASALVQMNIEYDSYRVTPTGTDVVRMCPSHPVAALAGVSSSVDIFLGSSTAHYALVSVKDSAGLPVEDALVTLSRSGFSEDGLTDSCGTAYFGGVSSMSDYEIEVSKSGFTTASSSNVTISGATFYPMQFE